VGTLSHTKDYRLFNCVAAEVNKLAGTICYYYRLDKVNSSKNAVYDEPINLAFKDDPPGLRLPCMATKPEHQLTTSEEGRRNQWDGEVSIARKDWEELVTDGRKPKSGDVIVLWGYFFDVKDAGRDGTIDDDYRFFTMHKLTVRRTTKYEPWRRLHEAAVDALED